MNTKEIVTLTILLCSFIVFIIWMLTVIHSLKIESRLSNHTIKTKKSETISFIDKIINKYNNFKIKTANSVINKEKITKLERRKKEIDIFNLIDSLLSAIIFIFVYIFLSIFYLTKIKLVSIILVFILGFILPGIIFIIKEHRRKHNIELNLLRAISLINNNLQSNKSITEALIDTKDKIDGDIKLELEEIINDLDNGLSLEMAFKRMQDRCEIDDIVYLTTALSILNKTGGNTKEVFNYLEDLFNIRKKLNQELEATIASAKFVYVILAILPIVLFSFMTLFYDNYIYLYLNTTIGKLLGTSEGLLYIFYIMIIKKIMVIDKY